MPVVAFASYFLDQEGLKPEAAKIRDRFSLLNPADVQGCNQK